MLGFKKVYKMLHFLNGAHLLGKYEGILLGATCKNGNEVLFHIAFAIIYNETNNNWASFLTSLVEGLYNEDDYKEIFIFV